MIDYALLAQAPLIKLLINIIPYTENGKKIIHFTFSNLLKVK